MQSRRRVRGILALVVASVLGVGLAAAGSLWNVPGTVGGSRVERTLDADLQTVWTSALDTLARTDVRIPETDRSGEGVSICATLVPVTPRMTKVVLRMETGEDLAEKERVEEILDQVALSLKRPTAVAESVASGERDASNERDALAKAVTVLQGEIRQLRSILDEQQGRWAASQSPLEPDGVTGDMVSHGSEIVVIPSPYGIPVIPDSADVGVTRVPPAPHPGDYAPVLNDAPPQTDPAGQEVLATPLAPVEVLVPVRSLDGRKRVR